MKGIYGLVCTGIRFWVGVISRVCVGKITIFEASIMEEIEDKVGMKKMGGKQVKVRIITLWFLILVLFYFEFCMMKLFYMGLSGIWV